MPTPRPVDSPTRPPGLPHPGAGVQLLRPPRPSRGGPRGQQVGEVWGELHPRGGQSGPGWGVPVSPRLHLPRAATAPRRRRRTTWSSFRPPSAMSPTSSSPGGAGGAGQTGWGVVLGGVVVLGGQDPIPLSSRQRVQPAPLRGSPPRHLPPRPRPRIQDHGEGEEDQGVLGGPGGGSWLTPLPPSGAEFWVLPSAKRHPAHDPASPGLPPSPLPLRHTRPG